MTYIRFGAAMAAAMALAGVAGAAKADDFTPKHAGLIMLNVRATDVAPTSNDPIVTSAGASTGLHTDISSSVVPSIGLSYFITDNVAVEVIAATSHHTIKAQGPGTDVVVHKTWVLPPTVSLQYHFAPKAQVSPYVGVGATYMLFYSGKNRNGFTVDVDNNVGVSLQAGADIAVNDRYSVNLDVKKMFFRTDAHINGGALYSRVKLDPWVLSAGVGYKF